VPVAARMRPHYIGVLVAFYASIANASPVDRNHVEVLDGDTIRIAGETFRLVGLDAATRVNRRKIHSNGYQKG
jgi:endonuclease YncB( thermonuclease family)